MFYTAREVDQLISDDMPMFDLTEELLEVGGKGGEIEFILRGKGVATGTELVTQIASRLGVERVFSRSNGEEVGAGETIWKGRGVGVLRLWKIAQNLFEYGIGVATYTRQMVERGRSQNPHLEILTTRKVVPFTKKVALEAVMAGGGMPHRVTTTETILVFENYINLFGGWERFFREFPRLKRRGVEKKWVVEAKTLEMGIKLVELGVDVVQLDKLPPREVAQVVEVAHRSGVKVLAAGGINLSNVEEYGATGVDGIVTTAPYFAPPADVKVRIEPI